MENDYGPEFAKFASRVRKELIPKLSDSSFVVSIIPENEPDAKFAVELGLSVMMDKPIIAVIRPGTKVPEKLARVVDRFVELDLSDPKGQERLLDAITATVKEMKNDS